MENHILAHAYGPGFTMKDQGYTYESQYCPHPSALGPIKHLKLNVRQFATEQQQKNTLQQAAHSSS
jgi:hypothetical protein